MGKVNKIDSNITGARYCEEATLGVLPAAASQKWKEMEPNSYSDFGSQVTTIARNPINSGRQRKKGVVTDINASGGMNTDLTQTNLQDLLQGFFFADAREKATTAPLAGTAVAITAVDGTAETYAAASGLDAFNAGDLVLASDFGIAANNGLKRVTAAAAGLLTVAEDLQAEASPPADAKLSHVGFQFGAGELDIVATPGSFPVISRASGTKDLTDFGVIPGEWIFIGGDTATMRFATAANNGFARVRSVTASAITLDKTADTMVSETGTGLTIQLFLGRVVKNEVGTLIKRRSYHLERMLGYNNDSDISKQQAEYLIGSIPNEFTMSVPTAEKVTCDMSFISLRGETADENVGGTIKSKDPAATLVAVVEADAFNTSSDISRIKLSSVSSSDSCPTPLFAFVQELTLTINNNASGNKALGVIGSFEVSAGTFEVGGSMTAYFADVAAVQAVQDNEDITLDGHFVKANSGVSFDMPLLALGDGRPNVEQDAPITLPLENSAATGAKVHPSLNHTLLMMFWDYLPSLADS